MELMQAIKERRSIRKFRKDPVSDEMLNTVLEAARWAPSWANSQCWRLIVVRNQATKEKLAAALRSTRLGTGAINRATEAVKDAAVVIVACAERGLSGTFTAGDSRGKPATDKGESWFMFDLGLAMQNLTLAAHAIGLGTVHVGMFDTAEVVKLLGIPENLVVVEIMPLGWPDETPALRPRKELKEIVFYEKYAGS